MISITTINFLRALLLSGVFLLAAVGAAFNNKASLRKYARLGSHATEDELSKSEKAVVMWRWASHIFSLLTPIPLTVGLHFLFLLSNTTGFIVVNLGGDFAVLLVVFFLTKTFKVKLEELFPSTVSLSSCGKLMAISFLAVLTLLTLSSLLFDVQLRSSLIEQFKKALGGK